MKKVIQEINQQIESIKKQKDPAERARRYNTLEENGIGNLAPREKVKTMTGASLGVLQGAGPGLLFGLIGFGIVAGFATPLLGLAAFAGIAALGVTIGARRITRHIRKALRNQYGSVRNARKMYRLKKQVHELASEDHNLAKIQKATNKFNGASGTQAAAPTPVTAQPAVTTAAPRPAGQ